MKKEVLGRGLRALIDEEITGDGNKVLSIPLDKITPSESQPRTIFEEEKLKELAASIAENGLISPIIVTETEEGYRIIAGERRFLAVKSLGKTEIDAIVKRVEDFEAAKMAIIENVQRENLNPMEEAKAYRDLMDTYKLTQEDISKSIGKSRSHIANLLRILNLPEETKSLIIKGNLTLGHAKVLAGIDDRDKIDSLAKNAVLKNLTVKDLTEELNKTKKKSKKRVKKKNIYMSDMLKELEDYFGTKVDYTGNEKSGKIFIEYYSEEDLMRIINMIKE